MLPEKRGDPGGSSNIDPPILAALQYNKQPYLIGSLFHIDIDVQLVDLLGDLYYGLLIVGRV